MKVLDNDSEHSGGLHAALLVGLTDALRAAVALGDIATARMLHATLGGALAPHAPEDSGVKPIALDPVRGWRAGR